VWDGTDAVMLSGETAIGEYPVQTVETMARIVREATEHVAQAPSPAILTALSHPVAVVHAACDLVAHTGASALVVLTRSGRTAHMASRQRPRTPILAITDNEAVRRQLSLWWGVESFLMNFVRDTDEMLAKVGRFLLEQGAIRRGETVVFTGAAPVASRGRTNFVKVQRL